MDHQAWIDTLKEQTALFAAAADAAGVDAQVPTCPEWTVARLTTHLGSAQRWAKTIVATRAQDPLNPRTVELGLPDDPAALTGWLVDGAGELAENLRSVPPDEPVWSWAGDNRARFWSRRMAHETAVHRVDAQAAAGELTPIDGELAADGIDELLSIFPKHPVANQLAGLGKTMHIHRTDGEGEWLVAPAGDRIRVTREHGKGDVALRGSASDLLLVLYNRASADRVEVLGDPEVLDRWHELAKF